MKYKNLLIQLRLCAVVLFSGLLLILCTVCFLGQCGTMSTEGAPVSTEGWEDMSGQLAFQHAGHIYRINPDASERTSVTRGGGTTWAPDGTRFAFVASDAADRPGIYVLPIGRQQATCLLPGATMPRWSPDGTWIAYVPWFPHDDELRVMRPDGTDHRRIAQDWTGSDQLDWSPDGQQLAYRCGLNVCVTDVSGQTQRQLTTNQEGSPDWSPDGQQLTVAAKDGIYVINADGSGRRRILRRDADYPIWSPDGTQVAFVDKHSDFFDPESSFGYSLFVMNADGSHVRRLTTLYALEVSGKPAWSPDGAMIAFEAWSQGRLGNKSIYIVKADGSALRQLVAEGENPVWRP